MNDNLNVLCQSSDFYCPFCGVMLESLFYNNADIETIKVYLISDDIKEENQKKLYELSKKYNREIKIIDGISIAKKLEGYGCPKYRNSYAAYYKIFASDIISDDIERLLYLDSDIIINGSLKELISLNLHDNILGLAIDFASENHKKNIGYPKKDYYNTGVILFDFNKWEIGKCIDRIINHINTIHACYPLVDQDIINLVLQGKIETLDMKYNFCTDTLVYKNYRLFKKANGIECYYSQDEFMQAQKNPIVCHMFGNITTRPWVKNSNHPLTELWDRYLTQSPWHDFVKIEDKPGTLIKIQRGLFKLLPMDLFATINQCCIKYLQNIRAKESKLR